MNGKLGHAYGVSGNVGAAMDIVNELTREPRTGVYSYDIGLIYLGLGDKERALQWLRRSCDERSRARIFLKVAPALDPLRSDPRFTDLLQCGPAAR